VERKPIRDIDLLFYTYRSYYDKNGDYIVKWDIHWFWVLIIGIVAASFFGVA